MLAGETAFAVRSPEMYENKITKTFRNRRALLRGAFPTAFDFLVHLETQSAPVVWLHTASNAGVYWQDGFLAHIKFIDIGEVNTGIRLSPGAANLVEGTEDRAFLIFPDALDRLVRQHGGFRHRWASRSAEHGFEFRHPAPSPFFRDLVALFERMGAQYRAAKNAEALEAELMLETKSAPVARPKREAGPVDRPASRRAPTTSSLPKGADPIPVVKHSVQPVLKVRESARPLDPRDTQRFLTFEHLIDAYFDFAAHPEGDPLREYYTQRLEGLEALFLCRLPRSGRGVRAASSDRGQVVELAWRCISLANSLESPFLAPVTGPTDSMIHQLWNAHGFQLGTPVEELRQSCRATFKSALLTLFPGIHDTVVGEVDLVDLGVPTSPPA